MQSLANIIVQFTEVLGYEYGSNLAQEHNVKRIHAFLLTFFIFDDGSYILLHHVDEHITELTMGYTSKKDKQTTLQEQLNPKTNTDDAWHEV